MAMEFAIEPEFLDRLRRVDEIEQQSERAEDARRQAEEELEAVSRNAARELDLAKREIDALKENQQQTRSPGTGLAICLGCSILVCLALLSGPFHSLLGGVYVQAGLEAMAEAESLLAAVEVPWIAQVIDYEVVFLLGSLLWWAVRGPFWRSKP